MTVSGGVKFLILFIKYVLALRTSPFESNCLTIVYYYYYGGVVLKWRFGLIEKNDVIFYYYI